MEVTVPCLDVLKPVAIQTKRQFAITPSKSARKRCAQYSELTGGNRGHFAQSASGKCGPVYCGSHGDLREPRFWSAKAKTDTL